MVVKAYNPSFSRQHYLVRHMDGEKALATASTVGQDCCWSGCGDFPRRSRILMSA